ncbi:CaiB/BaiF CoA transferase family protein [Aneurinibacillus tyrosinisolvens]|uniref:CaiB/BaiF CoA transferase family protein n=1 Tax=Aneurinibacillus tyrosinisolvens TaxID=1443435 RepID=UPI00063F0EC5|nr:CaiB/BaiF CoA-transferase family protein [Aneurinibacillus tyrosinisolvens]
MKQTLDGIKVLDLTRLLPGPLCSMYLADYGAEVVKVEDPFIGDYARDMEPMLAGSGALYQLVNRSKKSISLNLQKSEGKDILLHMVREADILIEGFRPGVMKRLGLDYEEVRKANPRIIYCSITGYGQTGPYAEMAGHDLNYVSYTGLLYESIRRSGTAAVMPAVQIADIGGGTLHSVTGILLALLKRNSSGTGEYIDVSMMDGVFPFMIPAISYHLAAPSPEDSGFNPLTGSLACYNVYRTADERWFALGALEEKFWRRFCEVAGLSNHLPNHWDPAKQPAIAEQLTGFFHSHTASQIADKFKDEDVCLTPVLSIGEAIDNPHVQARRIFQNWAQYEEVTNVKNPLLQDFELDGCTIPPARWVDTEAILLGHGYSDKQIQQFKTSGII